MQLVQLGIHTYQVLPRTPQLLKVLRHWAKTRYELLLRNISTVGHKSYGSFKITLPNWLKFFAHIVQLHKDFRHKELETRSSVHS